MAGYTTLALSLLVLVAVSSNVVKADQTQEKAQAALQLLQSYLLLNIDASTKSAINDALNMLKDATEEKAKQILTEILKVIKKDSVLTEEAKKGFEEIVTAINGGNSLKSSLVLTGIVALIVMKLFH